MSDDDESGGVPKPCPKCGKMKCSHQVTLPPEKRDREQ